MRSKRPTQELKDSSDRLHNLLGLLEWYRRISNEQKIIVDGPVDFLKDLIGIDIKAIEEILSERGIKG